MDEQQSPKSRLLDQLKASYASLDASLTQLRRGMQELYLLIERAEEMFPAAPPEAPCRPPEPVESAEEPASRTNSLYLADETPSLEDFRAIDPEDTPPETPASPAPMPPHERPISVEVVGRLSLAESFFYANELFAGNQGTLRSILKEIEQMSSRAQLSRYLYDTLKLPKDDDNVREFVAFIETNTQDL